MAIFYVEIDSGKGGIDKVEAPSVGISKLGWLIFYRPWDGDFLVGYPPNGPRKPKKFWREGHMPEPIDNEGDG